MKQIDQIFSLVSCCYKEIERGKKLDEVLLPELDDEDWFTMTAALIAWHDRVTEFAEVIHADKNLDVNFDIKDLGPTSKEVLDAMPYLRSITSDQDVKWHEQFTLFFERIGIFVLPETTEMLSVIQMNRFSLTNLEFLSLDQIDAWMLCVAGTRRANRVFDSISSCTRAYTPNIALA